MKHFAFIALALIALLIAAPTAMVWAMNECQLHTSQSAADACFNNANRGKILWQGTVLVALVLSVGLHVLNSRWKFAALAALAVGPWLVLMV